MPFGLAAADINVAGNVGVRDAKLGFGFFKQFNYFFGAFTQQHTFFGKCYFTVTADKQLFSQFFFQVFKLSG